MTTPIATTAFQADIAIKRGDTTQYSVPVTRLPSGGLAVYEKIALTVKRDLEDSDADALISHDLTDGGVVVSVNGDLVSNGMLVLTFFPADTSGLPSHQVDLPYDVQLIDTTPNPPEVHTILEGTLTVAADTTQATA